MLFNLNLNVAKEESDILLEVLITITPHIGKSILNTIECIAISYHAHNSNNLLFEQLMNVDYPVEMCVHTIYKSHFRKHIGW